MFFNKIFCILIIFILNISILVSQENKKKCRINSNKQILDFIKKELIVYCENEQYICDHIGQGTKLIEANYD